MRPICFGWVCIKVISATWFYTAFVFWINTVVGVYMLLLWFGFVLVICFWTLVMDCLLCRLCVVGFHLFVDLLTWVITCLLLLRGVVWFNVW